MLPQFGQIERRAVGPHGASRIKMEGSEKASLRNMRFLLAQHPVGVRVLQAAREAAVDDTRTPNPNPNPNANPNPKPNANPNPNPNPNLEGPPTSAARLKGRYTGDTREMHGRCMGDTWEK